MTVFFRYSFDVSELGSLLRFSLGVVRSTRAYPEESAQDTDIEETFVFFKGFRSASVAETLPTDATYFPPGSCRHLVGNGESVFSIAQHYGLSWQDLFALNSALLDPDRVVPGDSVNIGRHYTVQDGDTLHNIASMFGTSWERVIDSNPSVNQCMETQCNSLFPNDRRCMQCQIVPGQRLCITPYLRGALCEIDYGRA